MSKSEEERLQAAAYLDEQFALFTNNADAVADADDCNWKGLAESSLEVCSENAEDKASVDEISALLGSMQTFGKPSKKKDAEPTAKTPVATNGGMKKDKKKTKKSYRDAMMQQSKSMDDARVQRGEVSRFAFNKQAFAGRPARVTSVGLSAPEEPRRVRLSRPAKTSAAPAVAAAARPGGRFANLDTVMNQNAKRFGSASAAAATHSSSSVHEMAVDQFVEAVRARTALRDVHLSCESANGMDLFEMRAKPVPGRDHLVAFATKASVEGAAPVTFATLNTHTGELHQNHEGWARSMKEQGVKMDHASSIAEKGCELVDAVLDKL